MTMFVWADTQAIAANVCSFAWRDQGRWKDLRSLFAEEATISVSWYSGSIEGFLCSSERMSSEGVAKTKHWLGVPRVRVNGDKALAETDIAIMLRSSVGPLDIDITSYARFFDRFIRDADGTWKVLSRVAIYEKDRIDSVGPSTLFWLINSLAHYGKYPKELRHMGYGLSRKGKALSEAIVTSGSARERELKSAAHAWLGAEQGVLLP